MEDEIVPHAPPTAAKEFRKGGVGGGKHNRVEKEGDSAIENEDESFQDSSAQGCTSYFLDPDVSPWVSVESREGRMSGQVVDPDTIYCPNDSCHAKIGSQNWSGARCSCGAWVTPAFKILQKSVDKFPTSQ